MGTLFLAYLAGALTTINPCVLPLLPILMASAYASGRVGPVALGAGLVTAFTLVGVAVSATGSFLGSSQPP
jgi:cytochrome c-type biogenesis protein